LVLSERMWALLTRAWCAPADCCCVALQLADKYFGTAFTEPNFYYEGDGSGGEIVLERGTRMTNVTPTVISPSAGSGVVRARRRLLAAPCSVVVRRCGVPHGRASHVPLTERRSRYSWCGALR
jgi:hypothetical protein